MTSMTFIVEKKLLCVSFTKVLQWARGIRKVGRSSCMHLE